MLSAAAAAQIELELADFGGQLAQHAAGYSSSSLLAVTEDTPIHQELVGEASAALLFGHLPIAATRQLCSSWQGSEPSQEAVTFRSTSHPRSKLDSVLVRR